MENLEAPLEIDTKIADLSATGGTSPYTYTLKEGVADNTEFKIYNEEVQVKTKIEAGATKNITVVVTDKNGKQKETIKEITIGEATV